MKKEKIKRKTKIFPIIFIFTLAPGLNKINPINLFV
jgi:hypothetical protein